MRLSCCLSGSELKQHIQAERNLNQIHDCFVWQKMKVLFACFTAYENAAEDFKRHCFGCTISFQKHVSLNLGSKNTKRPPLVSWLKVSLFALRGYKWKLCLHCLQYLKTPNEHFWGYEVSALFHCEGKSIISSCADKGQLMQHCN